MSKLLVRKIVGAGHVRNPHKKPDDWDYRTLGLAALLILLALALAKQSFGASHRTPNFIVTAPTQQFAEQVGNAAEEYRRDLAVVWLGKELPKWSQPCPISLEVGETIGAGGATSFLFERGQVFGWRMRMQGSESLILNSVLPHEVTHTIFASHFRRSLPRWADEGACTTVEHASERAKTERLLVRFLQTGRGIPFSDMFAMREYPQDVMPLYAQGYSLSRFLLNHADQRVFISFIGEGISSNDWRRATLTHYGYESIAKLQDSWLLWVRAGSPSPPQPGPVVRDASYQGDCRMVWNGRGWVRQCQPTNQSSPPQNQSPPYVTPPAVTPPLVPVTPPATKPVQPPVAAAPACECKPHEPCQCDPNALTELAEDIAGIRDELVSVNEAIVAINARPLEPVPPEPPVTRPDAPPLDKPAEVHHHVVVADLSASGWPRVASEVERARDVFPAIHIVDAKDVPFLVRPLPQFVTYDAAGKAIAIAKGERETSLALQRIYRRE